MTETVQTTKPQAMTRTRGCSLANIKLAIPGYSRLRVNVAAFLDEFGSFLLHAPLQCGLVRDSLLRRKLPNVFRNFHAAEMWTTH